MVTSTPAPVPELWPRPGRPARSVPDPRRRAVGGRSRQPRRLRQSGLRPRIRPRAVQQLGAGGRTAAIRQYRADLIENYKKEPAPNIDFAQWFRGYRGRL